MDPDEILREIRELVDEIQTTSSLEDRDAAGWNLAHKVEALDEWLVKGGFLPASWARPGGVR